MSMQLGSVVRFLVLKLIVMLGTIVVGTVIVTTSSVSACEGRGPGGTATRTTAPWGHTELGVLEATLSALTVRA